MDDHDRQRDEMIALASIYNENEFSYTKDKRINCTANISPKFPKQLELRFSNCSSNSASGSTREQIFIEHFPPISLHIQLPDAYPSQEPPHFCLSIIWLPVWETSLVCQKLDEIWQENRHNEIIFPWLEFLQNNLFNYLGISDFLDVSSFLRKAPNDQLPTILCDPRTINETVPSDIKTLLISHNKKAHKLQFDKNFHNCDICLEQYKGPKCIELQNCGHTYCKDCIQRYIQTKLNEYNKVISCPSIDCDREIDINDIKTLCPSLISRYEEIMLRVALDTMDDVVYCPRRFCQYPIIVEKNDSAPICYNCNYCFCIYCYKVTRHLCNSSVHGNFAPCIEIMM